MLHGDGHVLWQHRGRRFCLRWQLGKSFHWCESSFKVLIQSVLRQVLVGHSESIRSRSQEDCCHITGYCTGNSDASAEPPVVCPDQNVLVPGAASIHSREPRECCVRWRSFLYFVALLVLLTPKASAAHRGQVCWQFRQQYGCCLSSTVAVSTQIPAVFFSGLI